MADVFISYSRRDEPFVERLREALAGSDKDVWVDREDIGPAVVWRREIELGIEGADIFAFVISPDSLRSEPCRREREYAQARNKRIVPLLRREPDGIAVPDELASRNYIYFRTDEEFAPGVASVLAAIDDLPEWAREHTRLLERAEEWEHSGRDPSFLLRGSDLSEAEAWLSSQGEHKEPRPTPLQTEYVLAGRKAATRRQRRTIAAVALALAVSVVLGGVALLQRDEAQEQRDEAIRQARLAESRELAATSVAAVRTEPWEALELAISAQETSATPEATEALRSALEAHRESAVLALPDDRDHERAVRRRLGARTHVGFRQACAPLGSRNGGTRDRRDAPAVRVDPRPCRAHHGLWPSSHGPAGGGAGDRGGDRGRADRTRPTRTRNRGNDSGRGRQSRWKLDSDRRLRRDGPGLAAQVEGAASEASRRGCDQPGRGTLPDDQPRWRNDDVVLRHRRGTLEPTAPGACGIAGFHQRRGVDGPRRSGRVQRRRVAGRGLDRE